MTSNLTVIRNEKKLASLDLMKMERALNFSKEDTNLYFFMLSVITEKHPEMDTQNQAWKFLVKQHNLQNVLNDLIVRRTELATQWMATNKDNRPTIIQQIVQLEQEIILFNEMHFTVKRAYLRFTRENFQLGWGQTCMVA